MSQEYTQDELIEMVRKIYPTSIAVHTLADTRHYRIWPTSDFFETRYVGKGNTEFDAWKDAFHTLRKRVKKILNENIENV